MACGYVLRGHLSAKQNPDTGKRSVVFNGKDVLQDRPVAIRCGQCLGCKIEHAKQMAIRCMHEAHYYDDNCFITLTFNNENLAKDGSLHKEDFQKFLKRLRKKYANKTIRYFHCGEYGTLCKTCGRSPNSKNIHKQCRCGDKYVRTCGRPHHHAVLFNIDFEDKELWKVTKKGNALYTSETLSKLWSKRIKESEINNYDSSTVWKDSSNRWNVQLGHCTIGEVTFDSASYVAQYVTKKTKTETDEYYGGKQHEYVTMSRRPGLGRRFYEEFKETDIFPQDFVYMNGKKLQVPKYYNNRYEIDNPKNMSIIKGKRLLKMRQDPENQFDEKKRYLHNYEQIKFNKFTERRLDHEG